MESDRPKLRSLDARWVQVDGEPRLWLRDPLGLSEQIALVSPGLVPLLPLLDGSRAPARVAAAFQLQTGVGLPAQHVDAVLEQLDAALLLEGPRFQEAYIASLQTYRSASHRAPALAGQGYPADPDELDRLLSHFAASVSGAASAPDARGAVSPHIDFGRGGAVYARTWLPLVHALASVDLVIVLGTDHTGGPGRITLTRQAYATPWGVLPAAPEWVDALADAAGGPEAVFAEELHHRHEHSIELAATWLHWAVRRAGRDGAPPRLLPVLCGSFQRFTQPRSLSDGAVEPEGTVFVTALRKAVESGRTLVIAAADLAHVGPAFGDPSPLTPLDRNLLAATDQRLLATACRAVPRDFLASLRAEGDRRRVCGLPPMYWTQQVLDGATGEVRAYAQCPADDRGGSVVSIAGIIYR